MSVLQKHFNKVYKGIIAQGKPSITDGGRCVYRAPDGSKCAFGLLLEDKDYNPKMDSSESGTSASIIIRKFDLEGFEDRYFYDDLQSCHDEAAPSISKSKDDFLEDFKTRMANLAQVYGLEIPKI